MESSAAQNSKKKVFLGGSSSYNDPDVFEIAPPTNWSSNSRKRKEVTHLQVIYIDSDDDLDDPVVIDGQPPISYKGKQPAKTSLNNLKKKRISSSSSSLGIQMAVSPGKIMDADDVGNLTQTSTAFPYKQFDVVEDYSDHYFYTKNGPSVPQPKNWAKRVQEEWKILEKDLPDQIFVRVFESRMDLLRAVIIGAQGTPYHDGLFFFDVFFPAAYPAIPPHVHYHSGGLRINPNLYECGKVCLSLLNTWRGSGNENWIPNVSTMLQVLVSIQALILNEKPYFNEPGWANLAGTSSGERNSKQYSENTFLLSLKTMVYSIKKPPLHFKEIVIWHFVKQAPIILGACKVYIEKEALVGSDMPVTEGGEKIKRRMKKCSKTFKNNVSSHITMVVEAFKLIGVQDCDKFLALAEKR